MLPSNIYNYIDDQATLLTNSLPDTTSSSMMTTLSSNLHDDDTPPINMNHKRINTLINSSIQIKSDETYANKDNTDASAASYKLSPITTPEEIGTLPPESTSDIYPDTTHSKITNADNIPTTPNISTIDAARIEYVCTPENDNIDIT